MNGNSLDGTHHRTVTHTFHGYFPLISSGTLLNPGRRLPAVVTARMAGGAEFRSA